MELESLYAKCTPVPESGCWLWDGCVNNRGYGKTFEVNGQWRRSVYAHRLSWVIQNGEIPDGLHVLHRCDVPSCIRPTHLFLGTPRQNTDDKMRKKRHAYGERNGMAKLSAKQVLEIRDAPGLQREIAAKYGCGQQTVSLIKTRQHWAHL